MKRKIICTIFIALIFTILVACNHNVKALDLNLINSVTGNDEQAFNATFEQYVGNRNGYLVKELIKKVLLSNENQSAERNLIINYTDSNGMEAFNTQEKADEITQRILDNKEYEVKLDYVNGYVAAVVINDLNKTTDDTSRSINDVSNALSNDVTGNTTNNTIINNTTNVVDREEPIMISTATPTPTATVTPTPTATVTPTPTPAATTNLPKAGIDYIPVIAIAMIAIGIVITAIRLKKLN